MSKLMKKLKMPTPKKARLADASAFPTVDRSPFVSGFADCTVFRAIIISISRLFRPVLPCKPHAAS